MRLPNNTDHPAIGPVSTFAKQHSPEDRWCDHVACGEVGDERRDRWPAAVEATRPWTRTAPCHLGVERVDSSGAVAGATLLAPLPGEWPPR
ncbi:hypothetical protein GCM10028802_30870 [Terrabacter terrigena]